MFGTTLGSLKGRQTRRNTKHVRSQITRIPPFILSRYKNIALEGDIMRVNGLPFLTTISRNIMFRTTEYTKGTKAKDLKVAIRNVNR